MYTHPIQVKNGLWPLQCPQRNLEFFNIGLLDSLQKIIYLSMFYLLSTAFSGKNCIYKSTRILGFQSTSTIYNLQFTHFLAILSTIYNLNNGQIYNLPKGMYPPKLGNNSEKEWLKLFIILVADHAEATPPPLAFAFLILFSLVQDQNFNLKKRFGPRQNTKIT